MVGTNNKSLILKIMKKLMKSLIKVLFVIIMPVTYIYISYNWFMNDNFLIPGLAMILIGVLVTVNAAFYYSFMSNTKMFPGVTGEFAPVVGLGLGFDRAYYTHKIIILIPFCLLEITTWNKKKKIK